MLIHVDLKQNPRLTALDTPLKNPKNSFFLHVKKDRVIELWFDMSYDRDFSQ